MDFSITREPVYVSEVLFDGQAEQGVEFDYVLPDYYPDMYKILKCSLKPKIASYNISGDKLICDGIVYINVLYLSENSNKLNCIEHRYTYSKTIDLPRSAENAAVSIQAKSDYCTCRAVSGRRLDVRGAVSLKIKVVCGRYAEIITDAAGCGIQTRKTPAVYGGKKILTEKQFVIREEIEAPDIRDAVKAIISCDAVSSVSDCKVISDKVVLKGEANIKALYLADSDEKAMHTIEADIPISQIIDAVGITDKHTCYAQLNILSCDLIPKQEEQDGNMIFSCEMTVVANISAELEETVYPVTDMYSTEYESKFETVQLRTETDPRYITQSFALKELLECTEGTLENVIHCRCEITGVTCRRMSQNELAVSGQAEYQALALLNGETPVFVNKSAPFELNIQIDLPEGECSFDPYLQVTNAVCSITDDTQLEIRISISVQGCLYKSGYIDIIKDITIDDSAPKEKHSDYSLKLYFAEDGEDIWNIAKKYNTSADAVMNENSAEDNSNILLIPIV